MMSDQTLADRLKIAAARLFTDAEASGRRIVQRIGALNLQIHNAHAHEYRRAAFNQRDKACY